MNREQVLEAALREILDEVRIHRERKIAIPLAWIEGTCNDALAAPPDPSPPRAEAERLDRFVCAILTGVFAHHDTRFDPHRIREDARYMLSVLEDQV